MMMTVSGKHNSTMCLTTVSSNEKMLHCSFPIHLLQAEMKRFGNVDTSVLKQHYEKKVQDLEIEKRALQVVFLFMMQD